MEVLLFMNWKKMEEKELYIEKGQVVSFENGEFNIRCVSGIIWMTWPGSGDVILREGDTVVLKVHGILCLTALTGAAIRMEIKNSFPGVKEISRSLVKKISACVKSGETSSVFGDSIHSITR